MVMKRIFILNHLPKYLTYRPLHIQFSYLVAFFFIVPASRFIEFQSWKGPQRSISSTSYLIDWETIPREESTLSKFAQLVSVRTGTRTSFFLVSGAWLLLNSNTGYGQSIRY